LIARQSKGSVIFVVTARDVRHPDAQPALVASVEASTHEFHEVGFSPCLAQVEDEEEDGERVEKGADGWRLQGEWDRGGAGFWADIPGARGSSVGKASCSSSQPSVLLARTSFLDTPPENKGTGTPSPAHKRRESKLYVTGMMVMEAFRRQGVAAALLTAVEEYARGRGINYICLYVDAYNSSAQRLYQKSGYLVVPFSPQAEAFASKIGLYKGAYAARQYSFAYRRLPPRRALGGAWPVGQATRGHASLDGQDLLRLHWAWGWDGPGMGRKVDGKGDGGAEIRGRDSRGASQAAEEGRWCAGPREAWKEQPCAWGNSGRESVVWEDRGLCLVGDDNGRDGAGGVRA
jgi:ribosomal protein S18 acetylase RimI-like enzyme